MCAHKILPYQISTLRVSRFPGEKKHITSKRASSRKGKRERKKRQVFDSFFPFSNGERDVRQERRGQRHEGPLFVIPKLSKDYLQVYLPSKHTYTHAHTLEKTKIPRIYREIKKNSRGTFSKRMCIYVSCVLHVFFFTFPFLVDTRLCLCFLLWNKRQKWTKRNEKKKGKQYVQFPVCVGKNPSQIHLFVHKIGQLRNNTRGLPCRCGSGRDKVIYAAF